MIRRSLIILCALLLGAAVPGLAQSLAQPVVVPALSRPASDNLGLSAKKDLDQRYAALLARYQRWKARADAFNQKYGAREFDEGSREAKDGAAEQQWLTQESADYKQAADAFKADVDKFTDHEALFDSRSLITRDEYDDARRKEQELLNRRRGFEAELSKLARSRQSLQGDTDEFAKIQSDAQIDYLHDVLMNIPASDTFAEFAHAKYITSDEAGALSAGYDALKAMVSGEEGIEAADTATQLEKILSAHMTARNVMMDQAMEKLKVSTNPVERASYAWLESVEKTYYAAAVVIVFSQQKDHSEAAMGQLGVKLCTVAMPLANYIVIGDILFEKKLSQSIVQKPLDSLNEAMSKNFSAQRYLSDKLDSVNRDLAAVHETVAKYEAVQGDNGASSRPQ